MLSKIRQIKKAEEVIADNLPKPECANAIVAAYQTGKAYAASPPTMGRGLLGLKDEF